MRRAKWIESPQRITSSGALRIGHEGRSLLTLLPHCLVHPMYPSASCQWASKMAQFPGGSRWACGTPAPVPVAPLPPREPGRGVHRNVNTSADGFNRVNLTQDSARSVKVLHSKAQDAAETASRLPRIRSRPPGQLHRGCYESSFECDRFRKPDVAILAPEVRIPDFVRTPAPGRGSARFTGQATRPRQASSRRARQAH